MAVSPTRVAHRYLLRSADAAEAAAPTAEGYFFDNPERREVRELAQGGAATNDPEVALEWAETGSIDETPGEAVAEALDSPPTPTEIVEEPGGKEFSTLNRLVVQTEEDVPASMNQSHADSPKSPLIAPQGLSEGE